MPSNNKVQWRARGARDKAIRDLIRQQNAPVTGDEVTDLYREIAAEVASLGLPESDAAWFWRKMNRDRWCFCGIPITDWKATLKNWHGHKFLPSQR